jgi:hypothetical protein
MIFNHKWPYTYMYPHKLDDGVLVLNSHKWVLGHKTWSFTSYIVNDTDLSVLIELKAYKLSWTQTI